jgi:hypothetical protein
MDARLDASVTDACGMAAITPKAGRVRHSVVWAAALVMCFASAVRAQAPAADVTGLVTADDGKPLPGAIVTASNRATGFHRSVTANAEGRYAMLGLPVAGAYDVQAELPGFVTGIHRDVALAADERVPLDFRLRVALAETVVVTVPLVALERAPAGLQQTVGDALLHAIPLPTRDFLHVTTLAAGFTGTPAFPNPQGQFYWSNNVMVDDASHFSKWRSAARAFDSGYALDAIKEVQVLTSRFSAEFGEALGSVTRAVTRSGTNTVNGSALLFVQDDRLSATPVFALEKPDSESVQYGVSVGGPFVRDRTHYFGSYEGQTARGHNLVTSPAAFGVAVADDRDQHLAFFKVDHQIGSHLMTARYNGQRFRWHDEPGGLTLPGTGTSYVNDAHTVLVTDQGAVSSRAVNNLRLQFARYIDRRTDLEPTVLVSRAGYSLSGGSLGPLGFGADPEDTWEAADTVSYWVGRHALKLGGGARYVAAHTMSLPYGRGAYFFAGAPEFAAEPYLFVQSIAITPGSAIADPQSLSGFGFAEDGWTVHRRLALNVGVRYDIERVTHLSGFETSVDRNNIQPRAGIAWDVTGTNRVIVRGGAGVYTQQHLLYYISRVQLEGTDGALTIALAPGNGLADMPAFPATFAAPPLTRPPRDIQRVAPAFRNPSAIQATIGAEWTWLGTALAVDYVRLVGRDLMSLVDANAPASIVKPAQRTVAESDATRPVPPQANGIRKVIVLGNQGRSWYDALQVKAARSRGPLNLVASYTLSNAEDMANYQLPEDSRDIAADRARASTDVRHNAAIGLMWAVPGATRWSRGWSVAGVGSFQSNRPYDVIWGDDRTGTTQGDARPDGRNTGKTGAYRNVDLALVRRFHARGRDVDARLELFNVFNAANYSQYVGTLLSPAFATPIAAFPPRRAQLAVDVHF